MKLDIHPEYAELLKELHLDTPQALLDFTNDHCVSRHTRGATFMITLDDGRRLFLKQDFYTKPAAILRYLLRFHLPMTNTERETALLNNARKHGFRTPEILACVRHNAWLPPNRGAMLELEVKGIPMDRLPEDPTLSREQKLDALRKAHQTLDRIQETPLDWRIDCKPEHFFLCPDGEIAIIDGERLYPARHPLTQEYREKQHRRFDSLLPEEYRVWTPQAGGAGA